MQLYAPLNSTLLVWHVAVLNLITNIKLKIISKNNNKETEQCATPSVSHSFKVGDVVELDVYGELCCDLCNEIIHNHIDCPVCKDDYAETDQYCDLYDETQLICEECGTVFEKVSNGSWYYDCEAKIVSLNCG